MCCWLDAWYLLSLLELLIDLPAGVAVHPLVVFLISWRMKLFRCYVLAHFLYYKSRLTTEEHSFWKILFFVSPLRTFPLDFSLFFSWFLSKHLNWELSLLLLYINSCELCTETGNLIMVLVRSRDKSTRLTILPRSKSRRWNLKLHHHIFCFFWLRVSIHDNTTKMRIENFIFIFMRELWRTFFPL